MRYKVLIPTSGIGTHLGELTKYTNKTLIKVGKKPTISYIIESYPEEIEIVVTLGYYGNHVKDFLTLAYPDRKFKFVEVDKYEGKGSSLVYSILQAKKHLNCPFIYNAFDTIVTDKIPTPDKNWIGGYKGKNTSNYVSFNTVNGNLKKILDVGAVNPDYIYIGLTGVKDHKKFWEIAEEIFKKRGNKNPGDKEIINELLQQYIDFDVKNFKVWHDTGNTDGLTKARESIHDAFHILDKLKESIFMFENSVVKFFHDENLIKQRVKRAEYLKGLVPTIHGSNNHFFKYEYAKGKLYSENATPKNFEQFLKWANKNLWQDVEETNPEDFKKVCHKFYYTKTIKRINDFTKTREIEDIETIINGDKVPPIKELLKEIDFNWLTKGRQTLFHGDFILDNIIMTKKDFKLLDWRQNFGGNLKGGDMYYDLAKLNHNLTINHKIITSDLFSIKIKNKKIKCDIHRRENLVLCQKMLHSFISKNDYDLKKVRILTALVWLNMSPLHHHPFDKFLFYFGKWNLWRALDDK